MPLLGLALPLISGVRWRDCDDAMLSNLSKIACFECGSLLVSDDVVEHGELSACSKCKPLFVQRIREGAWFNCKACNIPLKRPVEPGEKCLACGVTWRHFDGVALTIMTIVLLVFGIIYLIPYFASR